MRVNNIINPKINNRFVASNFKRAPKADVVIDDKGTTEEQDYAQTIVDAKTFLGITNLSLILHQSSFPVKDNDQFIGSHINSKAVELNKFLKMHGFDSIQLGPPGLTRLSPYTSSINSKNYVYTDFERLATPQYANILTINDQHNDLVNVITLVDKNRVYENNSDQTNFNKAFYVADKLYEKAYDNLMQKVVHGDSEAIRLNKEFQDYKNKENEWLEKDAVFQHFKKKFGMDENFFEWPDMCRNLFIYKEDKNSPYHKDANLYFRNIIRKHGKELDLYKFKQFITNKQEREFIETKGKLQYNSDSIIGFHMMDYYAHQDAFLPNYRVGTPYGGEGHPIGNGSIWGNNQTWDIPVLNPKKLFIKDENGNIVGLGPAGKLMRQKFEKLLDTYENIRIDHAIGLIDPWIYDKNKVEVKIGRFNNEDWSVPEHIIYKNAHGANISMMHKENVYGPDKGWTPEITRQINEEIKNMPDIDPDGDYAKILDEILLPLFKEKGAKPEDMIWETLGCDTPKFQEVFNKPRNGKYLPEITSAYEWQVQKRQSNPRYSNNWVILGCHDHPPFAKVCTDSFYKSKNCKNGIYEDSYIIGSLYPELSNEQRGELMDKMWWDKRMRVKTKFEEILRYGEKIQLTFMDFFGLDKTYNNAGTQDPQNWKLRLKKSYKEDYYKALEWQPGDPGVENVALNMPELLKRAVIAKVQTEKNGKFEEYSQLINKLDKYENMLREKE